MSEPIDIPKRKPRATKKALDIEAMEEKQLKLEQALKPKKVVKPKPTTESEPLSTTPVAPVEIAAKPYTSKERRVNERFDEETIINKIIEKLKIPQTLVITPETPKMPTQSLTSTETTPILKKKKFIC